MLNKSIPSQSDFVDKHLEVTETQFMKKIPEITWLLLVNHSTIQMKLICVWAERAILGGAETALKFKYEI